MLQLVFLAAALVSVAGVANAHRPLRVFVLVVPSWFAAWLTIELAWHLLAGGALVTAGFVALGALEEPLGWVALMVMGAAGAGLLGIAWRSRRTVVQVRDCLAELDPGQDGASRLAQTAGSAGGAASRLAQAAGSAGRAASRFPRSHVVVPPLMFWRRGVRHERGIVYGREGGRRQRLDVYHVPGGPAAKPRPAVIYLHGGAWIAGTRREQGIPLLNHLAANGWVGFNVGYRVSPAATWPEHVVDVKRAIAWVREHAQRFDVDPSFIAVAGGSAGGHLAALAALTAGDPDFQPGFEDADTSVQAAVPFYGVYDLTNERGVYAREVGAWVLEPWVFKARLPEAPERFRRASPTFRVGPHAPPFMVVHGDSDSLVPVEDARHFVDRLREASEQPVVYAEMQGAQHAFDIFPSVRTAPVIEGVERFLTTLWERPGAAEPELAGELAG